MDITVTSRHFHYDADANLQGRISEEVEKLSKFSPEITNVAITLDHEVEHQRSCEISVNVPGAVLVASAKEETMGKAINVAIERIKVQLKKQNEINKDHKAQPTSAVV